MKHTLLLRLAGPMQAWGDNSRFGIRETRTEPTKSGVIGLLCAALGWDRAAETLLLDNRALRLTDLSTLLYGVRIVREGVLRRDFHTAQNVLKASARIRSGKPPSDSDLQGTVISDRFYLSDAYFIAGLESVDKELLWKLAKAIAAPYWPLSLGRKSFAPTWPIGWGNEPSAGIVSLPLVEALLMANDPVQPVANARSEKKEKKYSSRVVIDATADNQLLVSLGYQFISSSRYMDVPLSFQLRQFAPREVSTYIRVEDVSIPTDSTPS